jgi:hypothetical protein
LRPLSRAELRVFFFCFLQVWGVPLAAVSFDNVTYAAPRLLSGSGRVVSREASEACPGRRLERRRFERVEVEHRTPPWPWRRRAVLEGGRAVCMQHMLEVLRGADMCGL